MRSVAPQEDWSDGILHVVRVGRFLRVLGEAPHLRPIAERILDALIERRGRVVSIPEMISYVWGDDPDGGPLTAGDCLSVHICAMRKLGFRIGTEHGRGFYIGTLRA